MEKLLQGSDMMIEKNTNYAYALEHKDNPTFEMVRNLSTKFYRDLSKHLQEELYETLNRGVDILDSEPQMVAYLHAFGLMHQAKLDYAFKHLPEEFLVQPEINIIDYGCGQAIGAMCYADYLRENGSTQKVNTITLIEPSEMCLKRAALHASVFFPEAEIKTIYKKFDDLIDGDVVCNEVIPTLHIFSNVLDVLSFDLDEFANLVKGCLKGYNQFVCVGPCFNYSVKDERTRKLCSLIQGEENFYKTFDKNEFHNEKEWTAQIMCFSKGEWNKKKTITQEDLKLIGEYDIDTYLHLFNTTTLDFVENPKNPSSLFFSCGVLPNGNRNYGAIGKKALEKIKTGGITNANKGDFIICVYDIHNQDNQLVTLPVLQLNYGANVVASFSNAKSVEEKLPIIETDEDLEDGVEDEFGVVYSKDGKELLKCKNENIELYKVRQGIKTISDSAFLSAEKLKQIIIPDSVTFIEDQAFCACKSLQQITIPDSVIQVGYEAFSCCESLEQVVLSKSITSIDERVFYRCKSLQQIIIPNSVTHIHSGAFWRCTSLKKIIIPDSAITNSALKIDDYAFANCVSLQQITLRESIHSIGHSAFEGCKSLEQIIIPNSVASVGDMAFAFCSSLKHITIPDSITSIGYEAFMGCDSLKRISIPKSSMKKFKKMLDEKLWDKIIEE